MSEPRVDYRGGASAAASLFELPGVRVVDPHLTDTDFIAGDGHPTARFALVIAAVAAILLLGDGDAPFLSTTF